MENLQNMEFIGQLSIGIFLSIVFLQSGLDKVFDWKGNLSWLRGHFKDSLLSNLVTPMLAVVTIMEVATGAFAICGSFCLLFCNDGGCIYIGILLSLASLLMLLFGQRMAKDYDGARTLVIYFGVSLIGLLFF